MLTEDINSLSLPELIDLLSKTTMEFLNAMMQKGADGTMIRDKRKDVMLIESVISAKKAENRFETSKDVFLAPMVLN